MSRLDGIGIDFSRISLAFDHDGNVHTKDIGQDFLLDTLPFDDRAEFVDRVYELREEKVVPEDAYVNGESYSEGEELGIFLAEHAVSQDDILQRATGDGFRDGFPTFLNDLAAADVPAYVVSAGDEDFLNAFYANHEEVEADVPIAGTRQTWATNGDDMAYAAGIEKGCGKEKKALRYQELAAQQDTAGTHLIASGDSAGDAGLLSYAQETDGLAISTGAGAAEYADIVIEGEDWYGQIAATLTYTGLVNGDEPGSIVEETATYLEQVAEGKPVNVALAPGEADHARELNGTYERIRVGETVAQLAEEAIDAYNPS